MNLTALLSIFRRNTFNVNVNRATVSLETMSVVDCTFRVVPIGAYFHATFDKSNLDCAFLETYKNCRNVCSMETILPVIIDTVIPSTLKLNIKKN